MNLFFSDSKLLLPILLSLLIICPSIKAQSNCSNPFQDYDILDYSEFLSLPQLIKEQVFCSYHKETQSCCSAQTLADLNVIFLRYKQRIEKYSSTFYSNIKNTFNPFLNEKSMNISVKLPQMINSILNEVNLFRNYIQKTNVYLTTCMSGAFKIFAGSICYACKYDWGSYLHVIILNSSFFILLMNK